MNARSSLFSRGQRLRFLLAEEIFLFPETLKTAAGAVVFRCGRGRSDVERFLLDSFREELLGGIWRVRAGEELLGDVVLRCHG